MKSKNIKYPYIAFFISILIISVAYCFTGIFPFGPNSVVTGDLNGQYMSYFSHFANAAKNLDWRGFFYSFDKSLGGTLIGSFAYYCASPLNVIYLFFTPDKFPLAATLILALKLALSSAAMCFFLTRRFPSIDFIVVPLSLCYGFCAYSLVYAQNIMWLDTVLMLPLVIYGIYNITISNRPLFYIITLFLTIFSDFYTGYMVCIFCVIYFISELLINVKITDWLEKCINFAISSICAGGLSAFLLVPMFMDISANKGIGAEFINQASFKFTEFFYRLFMYNFHWDNLENGLPNVYTGILCIVFFFLFVVGKNISRREKIISLGVLLIIFISMYSYNFMLVWHGFTRPVWFPYRNSFIFSFWLCYLAAFGYYRAQLSVGRVIAAILLVLSLISVVFLVRHIWFTVTLLFISIIFIGWYSMVLLALKNPKTRHPREAMVLLITILCILELSANSEAVLEQFENYNYKSISDFYQQTAAALDTLSENGQFSQRVEKTYYRSYTDPMYLGYPGMSYFGSTQDNSSTDLIRNLGHLTVNCYSPHATAFADSFLGIGNIISKEKNELPSYTSQHYKVVETTVGKNTYVFPMGYFIPDSSAGFRFDRSKSIFENQNDLYTALGGEGSLFTECTMDEFSDHRIVVNIETPGFLYLTLNSHNNEPVTLYCGEKSAHYFGGNESGTVDMGYFNTGEKAIIDISPDVGVHSIYEVTACVMDSDKLSALAESLHSSAVKSTVSTTEYKAETNNTDAGLYLMNIPYSEFLSVEVDGEKVVPVCVLDGMTAVKLTAGTHTITASGSAPGLKAGICISVLSLAAIAIWDRYIKKSHYQKDKQQ